MGAICPEGGGSVPEKMWNCGGAGAAVPVGAVLPGLVAPVVVVPWAPWPAAAPVVVAPAAGGVVVDDDIRVGLPLVK